MSNYAKAPGLSEILGDEAIIRRGIVRRRFNDLDAVSESDTSDDLRN
jgi:hypothetical protein